MSMLPAPADFSFDFYDEFITTLWGNVEPDDSDWPRTCGPNGVADSEGEYFQVFSHRGTPLIFARQDTAEALGTPTVIFQNGPEFLIGWALDAYEANCASRAILAQLGGRLCDIAIPMPIEEHSDGWRLVHWDKKAVTSLAALETQYLGRARKPVASTPKFQLVDPKAAKADRIKAANEKAEKEKADRAALSKRLIKEDNAKARYEAEIKELPLTSKHKEIEAVLKTLAEANLPKLDVGGAIKAISQKTKAQINVLRGIYERFAQEERPKEEAAAPAEIERTPNGAAIFTYNGEYDVEVARTFCKDELLRINNKDRYPNLCIIDRQVVEAVRDCAGKVAFHRLSRDGFWAKLSGVVTFTRRTDQGMGEHQDVPESLSKWLYETAKTWLPEMPELCTTPRFLKDGTLLLKAGYRFDKSKGHNHYLEFAPGAKFTVPDKPTEQQAKESAKWLCTKVLGEFNFLDNMKVGEETEESRLPGQANALAMLLTSFVRPMFFGQSPNFLIYKATPGEGASLLGGLSGFIFDGEWPPVLRYTTNAEEFNKALIAAVCDGRSNLFIDDVLDINSKELHRNWTSSTVSGRLLGSSTMITRPNNFNWITTGINPNVNAESARRTVAIRLNSKCPNPETRPFKKDLAQFAVKERALIVSHLLTMIQYWVTTGKADWDGKVLPSFEDWSRKVGGVLKVCGVEGFLDHQRLVSHDPETAAYNQFAADMIALHNIVKVPFQTVFERQMSLESSLLEGKTDGEKRTRLVQQLAKIADKTFGIKRKGKRAGKDDQTVKYIFRMIVDDNGAVTYGFDLVDDADNKEGAQ